MSDDVEVSDADSALLIEALTMVLARISELKSHRYGKGVLECPRCKGVLTFTFKRHAGRSRTLDYTAVCGTPHCVRFMGH